MRCNSNNFNVFFKLFDLLLVVVFEYIFAVYVIRKIYFVKDMKTVGLAARFSTIFFRRLPLLQFNNSSKLALTTVGFGFGYAFWNSQTKVMAEELMTFETPNDLKEGEVREIQVGPKVEDTILVIKYEGQIYSVQSKCAHFGFPLAKGMMIGDKLLCPLHNAGFSIKTGQPEQGPVYGGLKTFPV